MHPATKREVTIKISWAGAVVMVSQTLVLGTGQLPSRWKLAALGKQGPSKPYMRELNKYKQRTK
jgi:hypothetical protein